MILFLFVNLINIVLGGFFLWFEVDKIYEEHIIEEPAWIALLEFMRFNFILMIILYLCTICKSPGYTKSIQLDKFYVYLDRAIK